MKFIIVIYGAPEEGEESCAVKAYGPFDTVVAASEAAIWLDEEFSVIPMVGLPPS